MLFLMYLGCFRLRCVRSKHVFNSVFDAGKVVKAECIKCLFHLQISSFRLQINLNMMDATTVKNSYV